MKKLFLQVIITIIFSLLSQGLGAQESKTNRNKELHLSGNLLTFNGFGLQYKSELKNGNFFRLGVTDFNSQVSKQNFGIPSATLLPSTTTVLGGTFEVGLEKRIQITDKLTAFYGINFVTTTNFHRTKTTNPSLPLDLRHLNDLDINPGLGFNSGFIYSIFGEFSISAEVSPRLLYNYSSRQRISGLTKVIDTNQGGSFNLDNQSVKVSLIYHWIKE